ncbi:MAG: S-methyl-5'-thioinosine phosphorylase [Woeseia sp.]
MTERSTNYAIIAGSGFESFATDTAGQWLETPFGTPSAGIRQVTYGTRKVSHLARHGDGPHIPAHRVNYRANLAALARLGVSDVLAVNTVGVIRAGLAPGTLAVPVQLIDYTYGRDHSIYDENSATLDHVDFTRPFCDDLRAGLLKAGRTAGAVCFDGGVYAVTQGPRLETAAEIDRLERDGADFVGMTLMPEAVLARELCMRFACLSLLVNHAAGRSEKGIYEDIEISMESARRQALRVLQAFFDNLP